MDLTKISAYKCIIFNSLVRSGSPTRVARELCVPVSKIHNDLKSIEKAVGSSIILKNQHKLVLTETGTKVAEFARVVVEGLKSLSTVDAQDQQVKDLIIASPHGFAESYLPEILKRFHHIHPEISLQVYSGVEFLDFTQKDIDIVFGHQILNRSDLSQTYLHTFSYSFYASTDYLEKHGTPKSLEDFADHKFLLFKGPLEIPRTVYENAHIVAEATNFRTLKEMCKAGMGIAPLSNEVYVREKMIKENLVPLLSGLMISRFKCYCVTRKFSYKADVVKKILEIAQEVIKE